jgi:hypothetical protein
MATLVFTMIALRYIANPVQAAAETGAVLSSGLATATTRIGFGAFPLGMAIFTFTSLISSRRRVPGVRLVAIVLSTAILVRLLSAALDGARAANPKLFVPEGVMLVLAILGLRLDAVSEKGATV